MSGVQKSLATLCVLAAPKVALACAVCAPATDRSGDVYLKMTIIMSLLPLSLIGGVIYLFRRAARAEAQASSPEASPTN